MVVEQVLVVVVVTDPAVADSSAAVNEQVKQEYSCVTVELEVLDAFLQDQKLQLLETTPSFMALLLHVCV